MELKDMILSTLAELDETESKQTKMSFETNKSKPKTSTQEEKNIQDVQISDEMEFLKSVRERILVLFEGLQSPQNQNIDAKIDVTLNFLEFLLALIEDRVRIINSSKK